MASTYGYDDAHIQGGGMLRRSDANKAKSRCVRPDGERQMGDVSQANRTAHGRDAGHDAVGTEGCAGDRYESADALHGASQAEGDLEKKS
jgi:hypothetical protein